VALTIGTNTYISVAGAVSYCEEMGKSSWADSGNDAKEAALIQATQYLDTFFTWTGFIADPNQALGWPRTCAKDPEGRELTGIPTRVANACAELAVLALDGSLAPMSLPAVRVKRKKLGQAEVEYELTPGRHAYDFVVSMLRGIGSFRSNGGTVKVIRT
jgi:hypothetical protein